MGAEEVIASEFPPGPKGTGLATFGSAASGFAMPRTSLRTEGNKDTEKVVETTAWVKRPDQPRLEGVGEV
jgi:transketolase